MSDEDRGCFAIAGTILLILGASILIGATYGAPTGFGSALVLGGEMAIVVAKW